MTSLPAGPPGDPVPDAVVADLVFRFLEESAGSEAEGESSGDSVLRRLCDEHPESATRLREAVRALAGGGFLSSGEAEAAPPEIPGFDLGARLGAGGMGIVYRATRRDDGRTCAVKVLRGHHPAGSDRARRFAREVEALERLDHPGIVACLGSGEAEGPGGVVPFLVMELVEGIGLDRVLRTRRGDEPPELPAADRAPGEPWWRVAAGLLVRIARALGHAHRGGVIHRDLKTGNIILTPGGRPVLIDLGLASVDGWRRLTDTNSHLGSLPYMSPEQVQGVQGLTPATDLFSLGVVAHELLALEHPFAGLEHTALPGAIARRPAPRLRPVGADAETARGLGAIVGALMEKAPEDRPASAEEVADAFESVLRGERPVLSRRSGGARALAALRRNPVPVAAAAVLLAGGLAAWAVFAAPDRSEAGPSPSDLAVAEGQALLAGLQSGLGAAARLPIDGLDPARTAEETARLEEALELVASAREAPGGTSRAGVLRWLEADLLMALGARLTSQGRHAEAVEVHRRQAACVEALAATEADGGRYRAERARSRLMVARAQLMAGPGPIPMDTLEAACAELETRAGAEGASSLRRSQGAGAAAVLAKAYERSGRAEDAALARARAAEAWRGLLDDPERRAEAHVALAEIDLALARASAPTDREARLFVLRRGLDHVDESDVRPERSAWVGLLRVELLAALALELCEGGDAAAAEPLAREAADLAERLLDERPAAVDPSDPVARAAQGARADLSYVRLQLGDDAGIQGLRSVWRAARIAAEGAGAGARSRLDLAIASANLGNQLVVPPDPGAARIEEAIRVLTRGMAAVEGLPTTTGDVEKATSNLRYSLGLAHVRAGDAEAALSLARANAEAAGARDEGRLIYVADLAAEVAGVAADPESRAAAVDLALTALERRAALGVPLEPALAAAPVFQVLASDPRWSALQAGGGGR